MNDKFFMESGGGTETSEEQLLKALSAGYGTDSSQFTEGRSLIPEDCELTMVNAMREQKEDCKLMNLVKKTPAKSTVHEYNRRTDTGDYEFKAVGEGAVSSEGSQALERVVRRIKFFQEYRYVTAQMLAVNTYEDAFESEKVAGTLNILKALEYNCFHGDSEVVDKQFDGLLKQIKTTRADRRNIVDYRGQSIGTKGIEGITELAYKVFEQGGDPNKLFFPPVLANGIQDLARASYRSDYAERHFMPVLDTMPTAYGTLEFGEDAGIDRFFRVKGPVAAKGDPSKRPNAPASVTVGASADSNSQFAGADAGNYLYTVFAIDEFGISAGASAAAAIAVAVGNKVTLTITPDSTKPGTGFIICRSAKDGSTVMEMCRAPSSAECNAWAKKMTANPL